MKRNFLSFINSPILLSAVVGLITSGVAWGAAGNAPSALSTNVSTLGTDLFCPIINVTFWILIMVSIIMVFWAAFIYLTAGDDTEKVHRATKTITYAAVAIVVALIAKGFPFLVGSVFPNSSTLGGLEAC